MGTGGSPPTAIPTLAEVLEHAQRGTEKVTRPAATMATLREPLLHNGASPDLGHARQSSIVESAQRCNHAASRLNTAIETALAHAEVAAGASKSAQAVTRPVNVEVDLPARPDSLAKQAAAAMVALDSAHLLHAAAAKAEEQAAASAKMASLEAFSVMQAAVERPRENDIEQGKAAGMMHNLDLVSVSRDQMLLWGKNMRLLCVAHERLASRNSAMAMALNLFLVLLTATTSFLTSSAFENSDALPEAMPQMHYYMHLARRYAPGVLAGLATVLVALQRALGWAEKAEQHRLAAKRFSKLQTRYEDLKSSGAVPNLKLDGTAEPNGTGWKEWLNEYLSAKDDAPVVGEAMWEVVERVVERQDERALRKREKESDKVREGDFDRDFDRDSEGQFERGLLELRRAVDNARREPGRLRRACRALVCTQAPFLPPLAPSFASKACSACLQAHRQLKRQMELDLELDMKRHSIWERKKKRQPGLHHLAEASVEPRLIGDSRWLHK